ncbi:MAG: HAMP domain-containing protein [Alphaproteobacteria bacterium]|nr:MAG: HAMP domain-containing protein [Alphaproteobacteria bacterium]
MAKKTNMPAPLKPAKKQTWGLFSPLMRRILAVNMFALVILGGGILYLDQFRENLINRRIEDLIVQAKIISGALGESPTLGPESSALELANARQTIKRLVGPTNIRARLFSPGGELILDSRYMNPSRSILVLPLPDPEENPPLDKIILNWINDTLDSLTTNQDWDPYVEQVRQSAGDYDEVLTALNGETTTTVYALEDGNLLITVATPVQRFRRVLGGLMLSKDTSDIREIIFEERLAILKIFGLSLGITLLLSIFLASTIARPIHRLAKAADAVRKGVGSVEALKKFSGRRDEIGALSRSLSDMTYSLHKQIDAVESFAADVAHELKNPLSSLRSAVETIQRTNDKAIQKKLLEIVQEDIRRLDRLITDISDASRLDAELSRAKMKVVDFGMIVATIVETYQNPGKTKTARLVFKAPKAGTYMVTGIESRLGQVVYNLLDNAFSFTPAKGEIRLSLSKRKGIIEFSIDDEGSGLPPEAEEKIFERFYSERPKKEAFGIHSGLGLSISRQIIEAHSGTIHAENRYREAGKKKAKGKPQAPKINGVRFIVRLPE